MKRRVLRLFLGTGYVLLLTTLLLYQAGALGGRREWEVAIFGTLLLGVALAVVLALYLRQNDRMKEQEDSGEKGRTKQAEDKAASGSEAGEPGEAMTKKSGRQEASLPGESYEEIYARFLTAMEGSELSERELEVAWLLYRGYTNRQIGEALYIAETTVKKHVSHIYQKTEVQSRKEFRAYVQATAFRAPSQTDPPL